MDDKSFNLFKLDSKLAEKIYDDVFSNGFQKAGKALGDVIGLVTNITLPIAMLNNYTNFILQKNIQKYEEKLNKIKEEDRIKVLPEIGVPILDKLTYYDNEILSSLFLELLKKSSSKNEVSKVHPKYIKIIENLSEDEALILNYFNNKKITALPYINIIIKSDKDRSFYSGKKYLCELDDFKEIKNKENIVNYIENLISLGIFQVPNGTYIADEKLYDSLKLNDYCIKEKKNLISTYKDTEHNKIDYEKGKLELSGLGKGFLNAIFDK